MSWKKAAFPIILFLLAFYIWTLPIQQSPMPFGEGDAAWHYGIGDYIAQKDHTVDRLPTYVGYWYYMFNPVLGAHALEYPPSNHINYAMMESFSGERFRPVYIYKAITSFLGALAVYFLITRLYGSIAGFAAGFGLIFSSREMLTYAWGQQPTLISIVIVPATLYCFYSYITSLYSEKPRTIYLYLTTALLLSQYMLHIQGVLVAVVVMAIFAIAMIVKNKKIPLQNIKPLHAGICAILTIAVIVPFIMIYLGPESDIGEKGAFSRLFSWTIDSKLQEGAYPDAYFSFSHNYGLLLLPLILAAIVFLVLRRKDSDLLMLSWLFGMYIVLHLDVLIGASIVRVARMLIAEPQLLFSLAAIGAIFLASLVKAVNKDYTKLAAAGILVLLITIGIGATSYQFMTQSYPEPLRIGKAHVDAAQWISTNIPENGAILNVGTITYPKMRFLHVLSMRYMNNKLESFNNINLTPTHYLFDYSDALKYNNFADQAAQMQAVEKQLNTTKVYDKDNIKIYEAK